MGKTKRSLVPAAAAANRSLPFPRRRTESVYCSDRALVPRIKNYLAGLDGKAMVDIREMAMDLQRRHVEYSRRRKDAFRNLVARVYGSLEACNSDDSDPERSPEVERRRLRKRQRDEDDDNVLVEVYENHGNMMNDFVVQLYRKELPLSHQQEEEATLLPIPTMSSTTRHSQEEQLQGGPRAPSSKCQSMIGEQPGIRSDLVHGSHQALGLESHVKPKIATAAATRTGQGVDYYSDERSESSVKKKKKSTIRHENEVTADALRKKHKADIPFTYPSTQFSDMGGCVQTLKEVCRLLQHFLHPEVFQHLGISPPCGILLHGAPGCGKTMLANAIAGVLQWPMLQLAATELVSGISGETEDKIRQLFQRAKDNAPCILFLDEIDAICPRRDTTQREMDRRVVTQLLACMDELCHQVTQVLVLGATTRIDSLDPALRRAGRFDREILLAIPNEKAREKILCALCRGMLLQEGLDFSRIAHLTPGYVGADLVTLTREAAMYAVNRIMQENSFPEIEGETEASAGESRGSCNSHMTLESMVTQLREQPSLGEEQLAKVCITLKDFEASLALVQPSSKREGFASVPDISWHDVGALDDVKEELLLAILAPVRYPKLFLDMGLVASSGILLVGPPGCGKTLLAKAVANVSGLNFISVKGPELLNMYVGESERAVRKVFDRAKNFSPCVIFFDELDALCPRRSDMAEGNASARVVNQLLSVMDGIEARGQVFIMGATNRPDMIDPAVLRPGRFDKKLYVGLPSSKDREAILTTITKNGTKPKLHHSVDLKKIANDDRCTGFSGADLTALVKEASVTALKEFMGAKLSLSSLHSVDYPLTDEKLQSVKCLVNSNHFEVAFSKIKPSITEKERMRYSNLRSEILNV